jgi:pyruvate carboxylase
MAGTTSQPALSSIVAAAAHTEYDTGLSLSAVCDLEPYWEALRKVYAPFDVAASGPTTPTGRVYHHEIPGGQLSNLRQQAIALGLGEKFEQIEDMYAAANRILGGIVKVTPSSKVVGDLALHLVAVGADPEEFAAEPERFDIPDSVIGFLRGELGDPPGGWPEPFRSRALQGRTSPPPEVVLTESQRAGLAENRRTTLNELLFPGPTRDFVESRERFGDTSVLPTRDWLYGLRAGDEHEIPLEPGKTLLLGLEAIGEPDERGYRNVMCTINGQLRPITVRDRSIHVDAPIQEKADPDNPSHVAAPFQGVATVVVSEGDPVEAGQVVATIEAMKMEASITAPAAGTVSRVVVTRPQSVEGGDLLLLL